MTLTVAGWLLIACMAGQFVLGYCFRGVIDEFRAAEREHCERLDAVAEEEGVG